MFDFYKIENNRLSHNSTMNPIDLSFPDSDHVVAFPWSYKLTHPGLTYSSESVNVMAYSAV